MISDHFDKNFDVYRQDWTNNKSSEIKIGSFQGHLQETDPGLTQHLDENFTETYTIYCSLSTDVKQGDRLEYGGDTYNVRTIRDLDFGENEHKRLITERA